MVYNEVQDDIFFNLQNNATLSVRTSGYCTRQRKTFNLVTKETCQLTSIKLYSQCGQGCESCFEHDLSGYDKKQQ